MSKKFFLVKVGLLVFMVVFLVNLVKKFDGCYLMERCDGRPFAKDETGSGYLEFEESLQTSGLQSVLQEDATDSMDKRLLKDIDQKKSTLPFAQSEALHDINQDGESQKGSSKDVDDLKEQEVKISDVLTFSNTTQNTGFENNNAMRQDSREEIPSFQKKEQDKTNDSIPLFKEDGKRLKKYGRKRIHFGTEDDRQGDYAGQTGEKNDDDSDNGENNEVEDDVTIYHPSRTTTSDCPGNTDRHILQDLLSVWDQKARKSQIQYVLADGSLLGYHRNGNVLPWDTDVDVFVGAQSFAQIRNIAVPRNFKYIKRDKTARLVIQTDVRFPSENRTRVSCDGRIVQRSIDGCSFQDPIARVVRGNRHLDIYELYQLNSTVLYEPILKQYFVVSELYPPKACVFMGVETFCPSNVPAVLRRKYGTDFNVPAKICVDGKWKDRPTAP